MCLQKPFLSNLTHLLNKQMCFFDKNSHSSITTCLIHYGSYRTVQPFDLPMQSTINIATAIDIAIYIVQDIKNASMIILDITLHCLNIQVPNLEVSYLTADITGNWKLMMIVMSPSTL